MDKKQVWVMIGIALVVAVIVSVVASSITANVVKVQENKRGPKVYSVDEVDAKLSNIKANSCDADKMCETNNLNTNRLIAGKVVIADSSEVTTITTTPDTTNLVLTSSTDYNSNLTKKPIVRVKGNLFVSGLEPSSLTENNAYVCVNNLGQVYRSQSACDKVSSNRTTPVAS